mgnify:CR=1 FL=1
MESSSVHSIALFLDCYFTLQNWAKQSNIDFVSYGHFGNSHIHLNFLPKNDEEFNDGKKLYFASDRPLKDGETKKKDFDIWYVERKSTKDKWSQPINLGAPVNTKNDEFYPCVTLNNNLYFTSDVVSSLGKDDIFVCKWNGKQYTEPENLGMNINSPGYEFNAFVSPNEEFIIYTCYGRPDGLGSGDLYISYKNNKGNWDEPKNLGEKINSKQMDYCPFYDTTTQTLYFTSKRTKLLEKRFTNLEDFETAITMYENGLSRIYKYQIKL